MPTGVSFFSQNSEAGTTENIPTLESICDDKVLLCHNMINDILIPRHINIVMLQVTRLLGQLWVLGCTWPGPGRGRSCWGRALGAAAVSYTERGLE